MANYHNKRQYEGTSAELQSISWSDMFFKLLIDLYHLRKESTDEFNSGVSSLSIIAEGFKDAAYLREVDELDNQQKLLEKKEDYSLDKVFSWYCEEKAKALSRLVYRCMKGSTPVVEYVNGGRVTQTIAAKLNDKKGQNVYITGKTGSGKSETAVDMANNIVDRTGGKFHQSTHIVFSPGEFARIYNNEELTPPGSVIIYDEAGVNSYNRDALKNSNKNFNKIFQIIRHRSIGVIMTAPDLGMLDVGLRKLLHYWFETHKIDKAKMICKLKPHTVKVNQMTGKILYPYPIYDGFQVREVRVEKIPDAELTEYLRRSKEFKDNVALQLSLALDAEDQSVGHITENPAELDRLYAHEKKQRKDKDFDDEFMSKEKRKNLNEVLCLRVEGRYDEADFLEKEWKSKF